MEKERVAIAEGLFVEGTDGGRLVANKCETCGQVFFPKADFCFSCFGEKMKETLLSSRGKLYSYSIGHMPSMHFAPPHAVGYVDLPEGVRIFAPFKMIDGKPFEIGMEMEVLIEDLWEEEERVMVGYKFQPL
jgi:uncharacterized OB-fold protein